MKAKIGYLCIWTVFTAGACQPLRSPESLNDLLDNNPGAVLETVDENSDLSGDSDEERDEGTHDLEVSDEREEHTQEELASIAADEAEDRLEEQADLLEEAQAEEDDLSELRRELEDEYEAPEEFEADEREPEVELLAHDNAQARPSKWDSLADFEWVEVEAEIVNAYPPEDPEEISEESPIYDPQEMDVCDAFNYELCHLDSDCAEGFRCAEPSVDCQPIMCDCDDDTGEATHCTEECEPGAGLCVRGERETLDSARARPAPLSALEKAGYTPELTCEFNNINPNPVSYCKPVDFIMSAADANQAQLPQGCYYYVRISSDVDGVVAEEFLGGTFGQFPVAFQERVRHMSLGGHNMCFQVVRKCSATIVDQNGNQVPNPYPSEEEFCEACHQEPLVVELPELDGEFCGKTPQDWYSAFQSGTHCIDERGTNTVMLIGTPQDDLILGNEMNNIVRAKAGDDCVYSYGRNDRIRGSFGDDYIVAGEGFDYVNAGWGRDLVFGEGGNDTIRGKLGQDNLYGGDGDDTLIGGVGADYIEGGSGNDIIKGRWNNDVCYGGEGDDKIYGGFGKDTLDGGPGNDEIRGGFRSDKISGSKGDDRLKGGFGKDSILGGEGADFLMGDARGDDLQGGQGPDRLCGNWGPDSLDAGLDVDRCNGGPGMDSETNCEFTAHESACTESAFNQGLPVIPNISGTFCGKSAEIWINEYLDGYANIIDNRLGSNVLIVGTSKPDLILGNSQGNTIKGKGGDDCIFGYDGDDDIRGGSGDDTIYGGDGNDDVKGGSGVDRIHGESGNDDLRGNGGNDFVWGGPGADTIKGGTNSDWLYGDAGNDNIRGDAGDDQIRGGDGNDSLFGESGMDTIHGDAGDDYIKGGIAKDTLYGQAGRDKIKGSTGDDFMTGGSGDDFLMGDFGGDNLYGESGNDRLCGKAGPDYMNGGAGSDKCRGGLGSDTKVSCSTVSWTQCTNSAWNNY